MNLRNESILETQEEKMPQTLPLVHLQKMEEEVNYESFQMPVSTEEYIVVQNKSDINYHGYQEVITEERNVEYLNVEDHRNMVFVEGNAPEAVYESVYYVDDDIYKEGYFGTISQEQRLDMFSDNYSVRSSRRVKKRVNSDQDYQKDFDQDSLDLMPSCTYDMEITVKRQKEKIPNFMPPVCIIKLPKPEDSRENSHKTSIVDSLYLHRTTSDDPSQSIALICETCAYCFRTKNAFQNHMELHKKPGADLIPKAQILCSIASCQIRVDCYPTLMEHVRNHHGHDELYYENIEFSDYRQFEKWKEEMERLTYSKYTRSSGRRNTFTKSTYYNCHHSGNVPVQKEKEGGPSTSEGKGRNRTSKKMGRSCTAFFQLKQNQEGCVILRGCLQHTGHENNVRNIPLSTSIKKEIAALLMKGMEYREVVDHLRGSSRIDDRRHYIKIYEVSNVHAKLLKQRSGSSVAKKRGLKCLLTARKEAEEEDESDFVDEEVEDEIDVVGEKHVEVLGEEEKKVDAGITEKITTNISSQLAKSPADENSIGGTDANLDGSGKAKIGELNGDEMVLQEANAKATTQVTRELVLDLSENFVKATEAGE